MIHVAAVVDAGARLGRVRVGPFAVIGRDVELADGVEVGAHAVIEGPTRIGPDCIVGPHAVIGGAAQVAGPVAAEARLEVGARNRFREFCTVHRGSSRGAGLTRIGDDNLFMVGAHVAHDALIGSRCTFANQASIAGHVEVGDDVVLGGFAGVHQHARVGRLAMVAAGAICTEDAPPFSLVQGDRARFMGWNLVGLRRAGWDEATIAVFEAIAAVLRVHGGAIRDALRVIEAEHGDRGEVREFLAFAASTRRGLCGAAARWGAP